MSGENPGQNAQSGSSPSRGVEQTGSRSPAKEGQQSAENENAQEADTIRNRMPSGRAEGGESGRDGGLPGIADPSSGEAKLPEPSSTFLKANADNLPSLSPNVAAFGRIPQAPKNIVGNHRTMPNRSTENIRHPNQMPLIKMSTVTMASRQRVPSSRVYYNHYVENRRPRKTITWDEATNARPPLRIDMDGPGPCSYSPRNKPLYETNAPSWSFGRKTFVEKSGGSRTSWEKTWFQAENVWTQKADFYSDRKWPAPSTHPQKPSVGSKSVSLPTAPRHTFGYKRPLADEKDTSEEPPPNVYDIERADVIRMPQSPAYTHSHRWGGTCLWPFTEITPGPGTYRPERSFIKVKTHYPSFSIRGVRREKTHDLGPFAAF